MSIRAVHDAVDADFNAYEREREARIAANRARMSALGLASNSSGMGFGASTSTSSSSSSMSRAGAPSAWAKAIFGAQQQQQQRPKVKRRPMVTIFERATKPTRSSRRLQELQESGNGPRSYAEIENQGQHHHSQHRGGGGGRKRRSRCFLTTTAAAENGGGDENDENSNARAASRPGSGSSSRRGLLIPAASRGGGAAAGSPESGVDDVVRTTYAAPFSLRSIDVTVWSLGEIHRGGWSWRYWSSPGCLYHHAYPVGYRATKQGVFGRDWECRVEEGECGPVFVVEEVVVGEDGMMATTTTAAATASATTQQCFSGPSPTRPWTDACLSHRTGQRISGPLFFGFSDPTTQRAVASLYTPEELEAASRGEGGRRRERDESKKDDDKTTSALSASSLATERAALDFVSRYGVGEATACVLAHTKALRGGGGERFRSADELEAWARGGGGKEKNAAVVVVDAAALEAGEGWPPRARQLLDFLLNSEEFPASTRRWPAWRQRLAPRLVVRVCGLVLRNKKEEEEEEEKGEEKEKEKTADVAPVAEAAAAAEAGVVVATAASSAKEAEEEKKTTKKGKKRANSATAAAAAASAAPRPRRSRSKT